MSTITVRRQPSLDLRKAARLAELASKQEIEPFSLENDMGSLYRSKLRGHQLRLSTSSPILSNMYTSDEEQPSPHADEDISSDSEYASCDDLLEDDDSEFDGDDEEADYEDNFTTFFEPAMAVIVPMQMLKPSLVDLSVFAPMAARSIPISRPESASYATFIRVKAPSPTQLRSPTHASPEKSVPNFSTPMHRKNSLSPPSSLHSGSSPASSCISLTNSGESIEEEAEAVIRESDEIQMRQAILAGTEWDDNVLESPTPTSWAAYDPFALSIPTLNKAQTYHEDVREKSKGWRRLGLKSARFLAGSKRSAWN